MEYVQQAWLHLPPEASSKVHVQQQLHRCCVAAQRGNVQRRLEGAIGVPHICPSTYQHRHCHLVTEETAPEQRGGSSAVFDVDCSTHG